MSESEKLLRVRAVTGEDAPLLERIDESYAARHGLEVTANRAAASFHARTGHSFVAEGEGEARGFVLAHATWTGGRPVVRMERLAVGADGDGQARQALLAALVKSAYDAGVYDLVAELPSGDAGGAAALERERFAPLPLISYGRTLGSRGQAAGGSGS